MAAVTPVEGGKRLCCISSLSVILFEMVHAAVSIWGQRTVVEIYSQRTVAETNMLVLEIIVAS